MNKKSQKKSKLALIDFDGAAVETYKWTHHITDRDLLIEVNKVKESRNEPAMTAAELKEKAPFYRKDFGSLTQAMQFELGMPNQWCFDTKRLSAQEYVDKVIKNTPHNELVIKALEALVNEHDFRLVIATHSPAFLVRPIMEHLGWSHVFDDDHLVDIVKLNNLTKTQQLFMLWVAEHFGTDYTERHMLDDTLDNMQWARKLRFIAWYMGNDPKDLQLGTFDFHTPDFLHALLSLPHGKLCPLALVA